MKILTSSLVGLPLDWAIAKALNLLVEDGGNLAYFKGRLATHISKFGSGYNPTDDKELSLRICKDNKIVVRPCGVSEYGAYSAIQNGWKNGQVGPTPTIALMRCFILSELGYEVDVPDEFVIQ